MAEGGGFDYEYHRLENDDDDDDDKNTTQRFQPGEASTPHHGGDQMEMQTMHHEQSGLPEISTAETSFGASTTNTAWEAAKELFPNMSASELEVSYDTKGKLQVKKFGAGKKLYRLMSTDRTTKQETINKGLPKEIREALGKSKSEIVEEMKRKEQKKMRQEELASQTKRNKERFDTIMTEMENLEEEINREKNSDLPDGRKIQKLQGRLKTLNTERIKAKKILDDSYLAEKDEETLAEELAEDEENEQEVSHTIDELRILRKHKENLIWRKNQELDYYLHEANFTPKVDPNLSPEQQRIQLEQQKIKGAEMRAESKKRIGVLNVSIQQDDAQERLFERILNQKHTVSELKAEQLKATRKELTEKMEEAIKIANNEDADPEEKKIAQQKVAVLDFEIRQIDSELQENTFGSLRERVKEIFKKYGLTLAGIFAAAGATIGAIIGVITKALKDMGKKIANGLKTLGEKAASALPGLIGSIVSFLFKTAGQVFGFLAEHAWLLILAVVVFLVEKVMKKQR